MLRDLLIKNVPLQKKTIYVMTLSDVDFGETRIDSVMTVQANGPYDTLREAYVDAFHEWKFYDSELRLIDNDLRFAYGYQDALDTTGTSSEYESYLGSDSTLTSKKLLTELLLAKDSLADAEAALDTVWTMSMPEDSLETLWFTNYISLMTEVATQDSSGIFSMDSIQKALMYEIANSGAHVAPKAHAVLYVVDTAMFEYPIEKIQYSAPKTSGHTEPKKDEIIVASDKEVKFSLYPNPNDATMILEYEIGEEPGWFLLYNVSGKQVAEIYLDEGRHKKIVKQPEIESGFYRARVIKKSKQVYIGKVIVIK